jgi:hypothetical protein
MKLGTTLMFFWRKQMTRCPYQVEGIDVHLIDHKAVTTKSADFHLFVSFKTSTEQLALQVDKLAGEYGV